jgi:hypothetical protein
MAFFDLTRRRLVGLFGGLPVLNIGPSTAHADSPMHGQNSTNVTGNGAVLYPRTAAEVTAGVEPVKFTYPPGNVLRYGAAGNGSADDTTAIVNALLVVKSGGTAPVLFPAGYIFKITTYCEIYSNTTIHLYGTLQLTSRASGLFANGASNIGIYGFRTGKITDSVVATSFVWNPVVTTDAPAIHLRSVTNAHVEGLNITYVSSGILVSTCSTNTATPGGSFVLSQASPVNVTLRDNNISFAEYGALCAFQPIHLTYDNNYVYRCGDGGIWMMGARDSSVINNKRISPVTTPADVTRYGTNNAAHPSTWNDEQGMEFENCHGLLIENNIVQNFAGIGIDIKNGSVRVLCTSNQVSKCQAASICTREGDAVKNACIKVSIIGNTITDHGILHYPTTFSVQGAIRTGETYVCEIINNIVYGYQTTVGIGCYGPGRYQDSQFPKDAHQASLVVAGNCFDFKNSSFESDEVVGYTKATRTAIVVAGAYDSVRVTDNRIAADVYLSADSRFNSTPAITLNYINANSTYYPSNTKIDGNTVSSWGGSGIIVNGLAAVTVSGLSVCNNSIGALGEGPFIAVANTHHCNISGNTLSQLTAGGGASGILVAGNTGNLLNGAIVCNNQIAGGWNTGANSMTYGITFDLCNNCNGSNNTIILPGKDHVAAVNCTGNIITSGTTSSPRSGAASPVGNSTMTGNATI